MQFGGIFLQGRGFRVNPQELGERVADLRKGSGESQVGLAKRAGISRNYVSLIERGGLTNISIGVVEKLAAVFGISPASLLGWSQEETTIVSASLREYGLRDQLAFDVIDRLSRIPRRGKEPNTPEEWQQLHEAVRPYWQVD